MQTYCQICIIANRHGLTDLQEATQSKMASMYKEVCENEEFLSHIDADQLSHLLSRDDLGAPSETIRLQIRDAVDQTQEGNANASRGQSYRSSSSGVGEHQGFDRRTRNR